SWHCPDAAPFEATVKIRYSAPAVPATVFPGENGEARVKLQTPQRAVTPGQAAVCYDGDAVLGGGWIARQQAVQRQRIEVPIHATEDEGDVAGLEGGCGAKRPAVA